MKYLALFRIVMAIMCSNIFFLLVGCNKDDENHAFGDVISAKTGYVVNTFSSFEEIYQILSFATEVDTVSELAEYENSHNYVSMGRISDEILDTVDFDQFDSETSVGDYIKRNSQFIDEIPEDSVVMPKCFFNDFRYVASKDGLFKVGPYAYKVLSSGIVATPNNNISALYNLTDDDIPSLQNGENDSSLENEGRIIFLPAGVTIYRPWSGPNLPRDTGMHADCYNLRHGCAIGSPSQYRNDKHRTRIFLRCFVWPIPDAVTLLPLGEDVIYSVNMIYEKKVRNKWKVKKTKFTGSVNVGFHKTNDGGTTWNDLFFSNNFTGKKGKPYTLIIHSHADIPGADDYEIHFTSVNCIVSTSVAGTQVWNLTF